MAGGCEAEQRAQTLQCYIARPGWASHSALQLGKVHVSSTRIGPARWKNQLDSASRSSTPPTFSPSHFTPCCTQAAEKSALAGRVALRIAVPKFCSNAQTAEELTGASGRPASGTPRYENCARSYWFSATKSCGKACFCQSDCWESWNVQRSSAYFRLQAGVSNAAQQAAPGCGPIPGAA